MKKNKIFIIEDDRSLVKIITAALDPEKFEVSLALPSPRTLKRIGNLKPNLIVLDILLPNQSGFEFLAKLKNYKPTKAIPVLILSNLGQTAEIKRALGMGAVGYLVKADFGLREIVNKIIKTMK